MRKVLVLNTSYEPLNVCSVRRALVLVFKQKAEVLEHSGSSYRTERAVYELPHVIRLRTYVFLYVDHIHESWRPYLSFASYPELGGPAGPSAFRLRPAPAGAPAEPH